MSAAERPATELSQMERGRRLTDAEIDEWCADQQTAARHGTADISTEIAYELHERIAGVGGSLRAIEREAARPSVDVERLVRTTDTHQSAIDVGGIIKAVLPRYRLYGLWVQYHGDGTSRARKGEVVVSIQYGWPGNAHAADGTGRTVREATADLLARLHPTDDHGEKR